APDMRHATHTVQRGEVANGADFTETARAADVRLENIDQASRQRRLHGEAAMPGFAGGDRNWLAGAYRGVGVELFRQHRLLEPINAELRRPPAEFDRFRCRVAVIGIDHQTRIDPD